MLEILLMLMMDKVNLLVLLYFMQPKVVKRVKHLLQLKVHMVPRYSSYYSTALYSINNFHGMKFEAILLFMCFVNSSTMKTDESSLCNSIMDISVSTSFHSSTMIYWLYCMGIQVSIARVVTSSQLPHHVIMCSRL